MKIIPTFDALIERSQTDPNTDIRALLAGVLDSLSDYQDYDLTELAFIAIIAESDGLEALAQALPSPLLAPDGQPQVQPEVVVHAGAWTQLTFILADDGYGAVLIAPADHPLAQKAAER